MNIDLIAGARPNFIKIAPLIDAIEQSKNNGFDIDYRLIHTGQHYDKNMSIRFFEQLNIPEPHINLGAGGGTQAEQAGAIMRGYEKVLLNKSTDLCVVVGDVNSTMACAIVARKMGVKVAHVEGGIRSGDMTMPEEINRIVTDSITNYFFTTTKLAGENLKKAGVNENAIFFVGNTMIDTLMKFKSSFRKPIFWDKLNLENQNYFLLTLHRPSNVDNENSLNNYLVEILKNTSDYPVIFPVHPRTKNTLNKIGFSNKRLFLTEPMGYLEFNYLTMNSKAVITDSGGITEETTLMGVPCLTLRDNTERPETVDIGTNELIGTNPEQLKLALTKILNSTWKKGGIPEKWDGNTAQRIVEILLKLG
ncbi:UDP-N-acetylglucosamine 2-epimerase (non-hydrolyzing) [Lutibacter sp. HS1-25]|uniref:non-hydrolyzing UDP-N-acetylglucosamine 2-epimerase n=1 Tax=Lutibacter sp. HS1-25 TaxID=2485000 RepID=UPI0010115128|nr:UDP-N-acetylglucosamine 2-epimerase (non-hydrolyzing) [Lutibacter sp. HS1-25]RXP52571.1 UDP-N-acetylglucosamine 2-epimerase (non-hydrolyzing) [Lutibacter sp. HS1-25]